jgi:hypothetical protein
MNKGLKGLLWIYAWIGGFSPPPIPRRGSQTPTEICRWTEQNHKKKAYCEFMPELAALARRQFLGGEVKRQQKSVDERNKIIRKRPIVNLWPKPPRPRTDFPAQQIKPQRATRFKRIWSPFDFFQNGRIIINI